MMPPRCKTCNKILLHLVLDYEKEYYSIKNDPKLKEDEILNKLNKLFLDLKLERDCCRAIILTYMDQILVIV